MKLNPQAKLLYLITNGQSSPQTNPSTDDFAQILHLIEAAVAAGLDLVQIREKRLTARVLFQLAESAARITRGSSTLLLVNDRADIAVGAGADGVHLATDSLSAQVVRSAFGDELLIGVSTHSLEQASSARSDGADFVVLGPIFQTSSKVQYGDPLGIETLRTVSAQLPGFPILAIGGIAKHNAAECISAGATGIAAISMLNDSQQLARIVEEVRNSL